MFLEIKNDFLSSADFAGSDSQMERPGDLLKKCHSPSGHLPIIPILVARTCIYHIYRIINVQSILITI